MLLPLILAVAAPQPPSVMIVFTGDNGGEVAPCG
jgi:hypothetical protein